MKITSRFASFLNKFRKFDRTPNFWQDKYFSLIENLTTPAIEVYRNEIIYINKTAQQLLKIDNHENIIEFNQLFIESIPDDLFKKSASITLHAKQSQLAYNASILYQFSTENFILLFQPDTHDLKTETSILHRIEGVYKDLFEKSLEGICLINDKGIIIDWNQAMSDIFEVPREKYLNKPVWELDYDFLPAGRKNENTKTYLQDYIQNYLNDVSGIVHIEDYEKEINNKIKYIHYRIFPINTLHGRIYGRINLDITKRKTTELELQKYKEHLEQIIQERTLELEMSETRIRLLMKSLPLSYYSFYPDNRRESTWYSENIKTLSGYEDRDFISNPDLWFSLIHPEDRNRFKEVMSQIETNGQLNCEYRIINSTGKIKWILDQGVIIFQTDNKSKQVIGCILDITEHKESEKAIIENERNYREIFNSTIDAIFIHNAVTGKVEDVNDTMLRMYHCSYDEALSHGNENFALGEPPYDQKNVEKNLKIVKKKGIHQFQWLANRKDGTKFWAEIILKLIRLNGEEKIMAVVRDIEEKKHAETQIQFRSEFEKLIFGISSAFLDLPSSHLEIGLNSALEKICQFNYADLAYIFFFPDDKTRLKVNNYWHNDKITINREIFLNTEYNILQWHTTQILSNKVVNIKSIELLPPETELFKKFIKAQGVNSFISVPLNYQGSPLGFIGLASNSIYREWNEDEVSLLQAIGQTFLTNLKRKESIDALIESEQTHREIFNATTEAIIVHDIDTGNFLDVNQAMLDMFGLTYNEAITLNTRGLTFSSETYTSENALKIIQKTVTEGPQVFEWLAKKMDSTEFWVEVSLRCAEIKGVKRVLAVVRDISERKNTQEYIRKNEEKYRLLVEGQTDLVVKLSIEKKFLFLSPSFCDLFGKSEYELIGSDFKSIIHPQDQSLALSAMESLKMPPFSGYIEHRAYTKNGWRWIAWSNKAIMDETNQIIEIVAIGRDITYQKGVEDALRRSEDRFRTIVQQLSDIVFIIDKNSVYLYDTPSVKNVLGYNEGELLGKTLLEYVHPDDIESTKEKINKLAEVPMQFIKHEFRLRHLDERWVSVEAIGINMLQHPSINGLVITIRDITERKQIESRILDAIIKTEEHERERFAKNLHDDLGPLLSSVKMYINAFSSANEKKKQEYIINQLNEIVKEAIITTKEVSNDLSPHILINYGLISAIDSFLKKVPSTIKVLFENELISERLSIHIENSTYRIIKELVNNSLKHAQATTIKIKLTEYNNFINLVYTDNGIGMDISELTLNKSKGMGFSNIISRAKALNGIYEFETKPKKGFIFKIKIPINQTPE